MLDEQRRHRMINAFTETHGEETAMSLSESLFSNDFATKADLEPLATKADLKALGARLDNRIDNLIDHCATKEDLATLTGRIATLTESIGHCATKADLKSEMNRQLRWMIATMVAFLGTMTGIMVFAINAMT